MLDQVIDYYYRDTYPTEHPRLVAYPGKYEGEPPIVVLIDTNDYYDETSGDVESPTGWFGRAGKWLISHDDRGFVSGTKFKTETEARQRWEHLENEYSLWCGVCDICGEQCDSQHSEEWDDPENEAYSFLEDRKAGE